MRGTGLRVLGVAVAIAAAGVLIGLYVSKLTTEAGSKAYTLPVQTQGGHKVVDLTIQTVAAVGPQLSPAHADYVAKPFALDELLARIRVQLRRAVPPGEDEHVLHAGRVLLDLARRQARVGDLVTDLSDREFRLLHHLLLHVGEVISRERLLADVWGYDFDPGSNVVDVCVRRLRQKLGPEAAIETVRHAGYRLAAA